MSSVKGRLDQPGHKGARYSQPGCCLSFVYCELRAERSSFQRKYLLLTLHEGQLPRLLTPAPKFHICTSLLLDRAQFEVLPYVVLYSVRLYRLVCPQREVSTSSAWAALCMFIHLISQRDLSDSVRGRWRMEISFLINSIAGE